jgi:hypothetical protein
VHGVFANTIIPVQRAFALPRHDQHLTFVGGSRLSKARAAVEHAIAHLKTWRMLSEEGGRYRAPLEKYPSMLKAVIGLFFFAAYE